jgi:hypothetical protein
MQINYAAGRCGFFPPSRGGEMPKTYTLYLRDGGDAVRFVPALCERDAEAIARARMLLAQHPECETIEIFFGEKLLFTIERAST